MSSLAQAAANLRDIPSRAGVESCPLAGLLWVPGYILHVHKEVMLQTLNNEVPKYQDHIPSPRHSALSPTSVLESFTHHSCLNLIH